ncbi:MAG: PIN domain-containing protein [Chlorobi bacterium]|nr:PIN domain-containing protein [Chlorobiota bacterium]
MKDKAFLDTNVLIYAYSVTEPDKRIVAIELSENTTPFISTQVIQEFSNILYKKFDLNWDQISSAIDEITDICSVAVNDLKTIKSACEIARKYQFSFYDSLILSAALEAGCNILYTEDLQQNQLIENKLRIINPFKE